MSYRARILTPRERSIVKLIHDGCSNKEIATQLDISYGNVKLRIHRLYAHLGLGSRYELFVWAAQNPSSWLADAPALPGLNRSALLTKRLAVYDPNCDKPLVTLR